VSHGIEAHNNSRKEETMGSPPIRVDANDSAAPRPTQAELRAKGKELRKKCPRSSHATWNAFPDRPDPVDLIEDANIGRLPELVPIRHGRMMLSPFTFYRGTALNMATDLATTPATGIRVQVCGDAHLGNFRLFATPERRVIFDIHDLDETLPAPWEWDVKRLAASFVVASRNNNLSEQVAREAVLNCVRSYRKQMAEFASMNALDVWYTSFEAETLIKNFRSKRHRKHLAKRLSKVRERSAFEHDFPKLTSGGNDPKIREHPPTIYHKRKTNYLGAEVFDNYHDTLPLYRRGLLNRFELKDFAIKVVGVGSVGTACFVALLMAGAKDPLFLQVKEARASVLEPYAGASIFPNHGQRVIMGHRLMQSSSDIFLGWTSGRTGRHYYVRQLRNEKIKFEVDRFNSYHMIQFAEKCGATLARAHARTGEPATISGYLGKGDIFDRSIADFSFAYTDQTERDYECFVKAIHKGRLEALVEDK
jgi:uncharacterized protein (DUF2252 family)